MAMHVYFDDSGTHLPSPVVIVAGLLAPKVAWQAVEAEWSALLDEYGLTHFHMHDCNRGRRQFQGWNAGARDHAIYRFRETLRGRGLHRIATSVETAAWSEVMSGTWVTGFLPDPFSFCLEACLQESTIWMKQNAPNDRLMVFLDNREENTDFLGRMVAAFQRSSRWNEHLNGISFVKMRDSIPIQAADMLAYEGYLYWSGDNTVRPHFRCLLDITEGDGNHFNVDGLKNVLASLERNGVHELPPRVLGREDDVQRLLKLIFSGV